MSRKYINRKPKKGAITRSEKKAQRAEAVGVAQRNPKKVKMVKVPRLTPDFWGEVKKGETEAQAIERYQKKYLNMTFVIKN